MARVNFVKSARQLYHTKPDIDPETGEQKARLQADMHTLIDDYEFTAEEDFEALRDDLASQAEDFRSEREQLQDGSQAQEYAELAQEWVDAIEGADEPTADAAAECEACDGTGKVENPDYDPDVEDALDGEDEEEADCEECDGTGTLTDVLNEDWIEEARDNLRNAVDEAQF
jgi:DnaJ-class molecular chaperone